MSGNTHTPPSSKKSDEKWVLQLCHSYYMPFQDVARQYATLFSGTDYKVATVFLTGKRDDNIARLVCSDDIIFLENTSKDIRGLKFKQIRQVQKLCNIRSYTFCIAHRFKPVYIATHVKNLHVIGVHHAFGDYDRWSRRLYAQMRQKQLALIGVSNAVRDNIRSSLPHFPPEKIVTLYNRLDIQKHRAALIGREEARVSLKLPKSAYIFGNVGRLHPDKDQATLIKAFALVSSAYSNAYLVIMGKGKLKEDLEGLAASLKISDKVIFTGPVPNGPYYFKAFDSFVLSSNHEPFGMVVLEAMIAGLPMAICNTGGAPEVAGHTGMMFNLGDHHALSEKMKALLTLPKYEKEKLLTSMNKRLESYFSDNSIRRNFWDFDFIKQ